MRPRSAGRHSIGTGNPDPRPAITERDHGEGLTHLEHALDRARVEHGDAAAGRPFERVFVDVGGIYTFDVECPFLVEDLPVPAPTSR